MSDVPPPPLPPSATDTASQGSSQPPEDDTVSPPNPETSVPPPPPQAPQTPTKVPLSSSRKHTKSGTHTKPHKKASSTESTPRDHQTDSSSRKSPSGSQKTSQTATPRGTHSSSASNLQQTSETVVPTAPQTPPKSADSSTTPDQTTVDVPPPPVVDKVYVPPPPIVADDVPVPPPPVVTITDISVPPPPAVDEVYVPPPPVVDVVPGTTDDNDIPPPSTDSPSQSRKTGKEGHAKSPVPMKRAGNSVGNVLGSSSRPQTTSSVRLSESAPKFDLSLSDSVSVPAKPAPNSTETDAKTLVLPPSQVSSAPLPPDTKHDTKPMDSSQHKMHTNTSSSTLLGSVFGRRGNISSSGSFHGGMTMSDSALGRQGRPMEVLRVMREGYLLVKAGSGRWKKKYVCVTPRELCVFKNDTDSRTPNPIVGLQFAVVKPRATHDEKPAFDVVTTTMTLSLMAADETERSEWMTHVQQAIEKLVLESADMLKDGTQQAHAQKQEDEATAAKKRARLQELMTRPENRVCCDCQRVDPQWASVNLGCFLCIVCSGIHRGIGVHITKVRSVTMDTWTDEQIDKMEAMGNKKVNEIYEAMLPRFFIKPHADTPIEEQRRFTVDKYVNQLYMTEEEKAKHPIVTTPPPAPQQSPQQSPPAMHRPATPTPAEIAKAAFAPENSALLKEAIVTALESDADFRDKVKALLLK